MGGACLMTPALPGAQGASALEGMDRHDLDGYAVGYKPGRHTGSKFVELTLISGNGKIRH